MVPKMPAARSRCWGAMRWGQLVDHLDVEDLKGSSVVSVAFPITVMTQHQLLRLLQGFHLMKYRPDYPETFETIGDAREFVARYVPWHNQHHTHSGIEAARSRGAQMANG